MKLALYIRARRLREDSRTAELRKALSAFASLCEVSAPDDLTDDTDMLLAVGGDGTFLDAAALLRGRDIPLLGVNLGRLGFLSENSPEAVAQLLRSGDYTIEERGMLELRGEGLPPMAWNCALNEISILRRSSAMLGIDVLLDGRPLPTYWADGLLVATPSGSTAYSLSVGGPIVTPSARVNILSPVAPHNLNVRPLVISDSSRLELSFQAREDTLSLSLDNRSTDLPASARLEVALARFSLKRVRPGGSDFVQALTSKLFWGEDIRNFK